MLHPPACPQAPPTGVCPQAPSPPSMPPSPLDDHLRAFLHKGSFCHNYFNILDLVVVAVSPSPWDYEWGQLALRGWLAAWEWHL